MNRLYLDEVYLPSKGRLYDPGFVPDGLVTLTMMGTAEEKLIAGSRAGVDRLITTLLSRCIVEPKIDPRKLLMADRMFLLMRLRQLSIGDAYGFRLACPVCGKTSRFDYSLANLRVYSLEDDFIEPIELELPLLKEKVYLKLLRGEDEEAIMSRVRQQEDSGRSGEGDPTYLWRLARYIHHTDTVEVNDEPGKLKFVSELKMKDSLAIRQSVEDLKLGIDLNIEVSCDCGNGIETVLPFTEEFFRPSL